MARSKRPRRVRALTALALAVFLSLLGWTTLHQSGGRPHLGAGTSAAPAVAVPVAPTLGPIELVPARTSRLPAALEDAAAAVTRHGVLLAGGLTSADVSSDEITLVRGARSQALGRLPVALHDAAAATVGGDTYVFGGGTGTAQLDQILRIDAAGHVAPAGRLPAASSDQAATGLRGAIYVVGGYTGTRWLDTVVAFRPGRPPRIVAHLPTPTRYAAVSSASNRLIVAGGSLPDGNASRAVYTVDPSTGHVRRIASLPTPTTHAAAAAIGRTVFVLGGRGAVVGTPTDRIVAIDLPGARVRSGGHLPEALSDLAAVTIGGRVWIAGGKGANGVVSRVTQFVPRRSATPARSRRTLDVYAADSAGNLTGAARLARPLVYVPNSRSGTVDVIDPSTYKVVEHFAVGDLPQHVVPSWDLKTLYVTNDTGNSLTPINPKTGKPGRMIPVEDPYNMYFTPDGRYAIVVAERLARLDFRDAHTFRLKHSLPVPCRGVDHMDFSADGSYLVASCEFSSQLVEVDVARQKVVATITLPRVAGPQDVKLSPDGSVFYVADMINGGVWLVKGRPLRRLGFIPTGAGAHGLYPSRDATQLYVTNRSAGTISVIDFATRKTVATWTIPGSSPDMGNVSADGKVLWLSGRYGGEVYAISTVNGQLLARINVGLGPHGLCVWPQPGRYSLGHTGILR
jgi:YVTN family beta-propeller protein